MLYTGDSRTASINPPDDATGVLTHAGAAFDVDEHNGRSVVIIDGNAAGNIYTIDDTAAQSVTCTGDNLFSDGVRSGDAFKVFYNLKNTSAHTHDGVDSYLGTMAKIKVGTYTGDGAQDQGIAGVGFTPTVVLLCADDGAGGDSGYIKISGMGTSALASASGAVIANHLISLDADGFSVDDNAADDHPNTNGQGYVYVAWR